MLYFFKIVSTIIITMQIAFQPDGVVESEFEAKLKKFSTLNRTISCDFEQTKKIPKIKNSISSNGIFYYDNSGLMALNYTTPKGDRVVMNGDAFTIVTSGKIVKSDSSSNPGLSQLSLMMQSTMSGDITKLGRGWNRTIVRVEGGYKVLLSPSDRMVRKYIDLMTMFFDDSDLTLNMLRIDDKSGGYIVYQFKNKKVNCEIDHSIFVVD